MTETNGQTPAPKFKRILLKLSGEALMGDDAFGINRATLASIVEDIKDVLSLGVELGIAATASAVWLWARPVWTAQPATTWGCLRPS